MHEGVRYSPAAKQGMAQEAKVTPFADGNEADVRKNAAGGFFQLTRESIMSILSTLAGALEGAANPGTASAPGGATAGAGPLAGVSGALVLSQILSVI